MLTKEEVLSVLDPKDIVALLRSYRPNVEFAKIHPDAVKPDYAHINDSGADLFSVADAQVFPGETGKIPTGIVVALEEGWELQVRSKGGPASKSIWVANSPGTVDEGFRGEIFVLYHNGTNQVIDVKKGQKLAQAVVAMFWQADYTEKDSAEALRPARSDRGAGCLGSTGVQAGV